MTGPCPENGPFTDQTTKELRTCAMNERSHGATRLCIGSGTGLTSGTGFCWSVNWKKIVAVTIMKLSKQYCQRATAGKMTCLAKLCSSCMGCLELIQLSKIPAKTVSCSFSIFVYSGFSSAFSRSFAPILAVVPGISSETSSPIILRTTVCAAAVTTRRSSFASSFFSSVTRIPFVWFWTAAKGASNQGEKQASVVRDYPLTGPMSERNTNGGDAMCALTSSVQSEGGRAYPMPSNLPVKLGRVVHAARPFFCGGALC